MALHEEVFGSQPTQFSFSLVKPSEQEIQAEAKINWRTFTDLDANVELCEFEYDMNKQYLNYRQPGDVFSGTLETFNFDSFMKDSNYSRKMLTLPDPEHRKPKQQPVVDE